jgi:uncharacterized protein YjiS (DUF1127 family)
MSEPRTDTVRRARRPAAGALRWVKGLMAILRHRRDIELLAGFDDHMLADIGLTRGDLRDAIAAPQWRDPTVLLNARRHERLDSRREAVSNLAGPIVDGTAFGPRADASSRVGGPLLTLVR